VFGQRDTLIVLIGFADDENTYDPVAMHDGVFDDDSGTDALYREASRGKMWLGGIDDPEGDVWGPYEAPTDGCSTLTYSEVSALALDAAELDGVDVDAYQHRIYSFPPVDSCPGGGIGGGNQVWVFGITPQYIWDWVGHEAAHGFGFGHASSYDDCTVAGDPITIGGACSHNEYGDPTDIQGRRNFQFSSWHMERAGWLEPENVAVLDASERIVLVPIETESDQVQSLRVPREENEAEGEFFHFEYRQPIGFDEGLEASLTNGILIRTVVDPDGGGNPHLLDMTPETADNIDAALPVGSSFEDGNVRVTLVEATTEHAILDVAIDGIPPDPGSGGTSAASGGSTGAGGNDPSDDTGGSPNGAPGVGGGAGDGDSGAAQEDGGCGCRTARGSTRAPFSALAALLGLWLVARVRRRVHPV
jgi:MYXO-CTERM domain-containing protein